MNRIALALAVLTLSTLSVNTFAKSPDKHIVMRIDTLKITADEYNYMYQKNIEQQHDKTTPADYAQLYADYKMKVLAAKEAGIDTIPSIRADIKAFKRDLAAPYLRDKNIDDSLARVAYSHKLYDVKIKHILLAPRNRNDQTINFIALADSLIEELRNGADFDDITRRYSVIPPMLPDGTMGWLQRGAFPFAFESAAYDTPLGEIAGPIATRYGVHIIQPVQRRNSIGNVRARHILLSTQKVDEETRKQKRRLADSLVNVARSGVDFAMLASQYSDEPQGRNSGGELPPFGAGMMVPEFEDAAFALNDGEISDVVETPFGYHIIKMEQHLGIPEYTEVENNLLESIKKDDVGRMAVDRMRADFARKFKAKAIKGPSLTVEKIIRRNNGLNSASRSAIANIQVPFATIDKCPLYVSEIMDRLPLGNLETEEAIAAFYTALNQSIDAAVTNRMIETLPSRETTYRHLINEYIDGILLYEISNRRVWNKANTDSIGLADCFNRHKAELQWTKSHYKGYVIAAQNDSIADEALNFIASCSGMPFDILSKEVLKKFEKKAKVERVVTGKGDNAVIDYVAFDGPFPGNVGRWNAFRSCNGRIIDQPEVAADVKGRISIIYQQELENQWLNELHSKYTVKYFN